jgi:hypothetical protein
MRRGGQEHAWKAKRREAEVGCPVKHPTCDARRSYGPGPHRVPGEADGRSIASGTRARFPTGRSTPCRFPFARQAPFATIPMHVEPSESPRKRECRAHAQPPLRGCRTTNDPRPRMGTHGTRSSGP